MCIQIKQDLDSSYIQGLFTVKHLNSSFTLFYIIYLFVWHGHSSFGAGKSTEALDEEGTEDLKLSLGCFANLGAFLSVTNSPKKK